MELILDDSLTFISAEIPPDSIIGQNIFWNFDSLGFFEEKIIRLIVLEPDFNSIGDTLISSINVTTSDSTGIYIFSDTLTGILICSYDPNDKIVSPKGAGYEGTVSKYDSLKFTVRFQNTGNDIAESVKVRDKIDPSLNIASIKILGTSHQPVDVYIEQNNWLVFSFDSIMLPDSSTDFLGSQGFAKFSIAIDTTVLPNTQIFNSAQIYFDNNPAIITNKVLNTIECDHPPAPPTIYLMDSLLIGSTNYSLQWYFNDSVITGAVDTVYQPVLDGNYTIMVTDTYGCSAMSDIFTYYSVSKMNTGAGLITRVYPNPFNNYTIIEFSDNMNRDYEFVLYNLLGIEVRRYSDIKDKTLKVNKSELGQGMYLGIIVYSGSKLKFETVKLIIE
ncbi:MAG: T9SS type A sorting domain-containing protein [Bacteroidota bacterium]